MRCRDFVAGLLLAGAGRRRATRRREQQHVGCNQATTEISLPHWTDGAGAPPHGAASSGRPMSRCVKVCGCRPHDGGAARTGAGVRKPPMEETAGRDT